MGCKKVNMGSKNRNIKSESGKQNQKSNLEVNIDLIILFPKL